MLEFFQQLTIETWHVFTDAAPYVIFGFLAAGLINPGHEEKPAWFKVSFLDLFEDISEAAENNKRLMVYYYQDGDPRN